MSSFAHKPVLLREALDALRPRAGGCYADGTVGGGGHAEAVLAASAPDGRLYGCDRDEEALRAASARLGKFAGRFELRQGNFADLVDWVPLGSCDGILLDLGMSSRQVQAPERGFSFQADGDLDMRMDRRQSLTAAELVNNASAEELAKLFWELGGERDARRLARVIAEARRAERLATTRQLAGLIERVARGRGKRTHPATKIFQALRVAVNDEVGSLERGLGEGLKILKPGGRLAVITFNSLEDRIVKSFGRIRARDYELPGQVDIPELRVPRMPEVKWVTRKAVKPGGEELADNPRSRSAQLRVIEKL